MAKKGKNPAAVALARLAVKARMKKISPERRSEIARRAALARWGRGMRQPETIPPRKSAPKGGGR